MSDGASVVEISDKSVVSVWRQGTIASAQKTLDNIVYMMKRETTERFTARIQKLIDEAVDGSATTSDIASLSLYVDLLQRYENNGAFCDLKELSERLNAHDLHISIISELRLAEEENVA